MENENKDVVEQTATTNNSDEIAELKETIANLEKINAKQKESLDKASSDVAAYKKRERERSNNEEQSKSLTEELQARIETLEIEKNQAKFVSLVTKSGVEEDSITTLMESYFQKDVESFADSFNKIIESVRDKALKENALDKLSTTKRPENAAVSTTVITQEQFNKMGYNARFKLASENPELYAQLTK